MGHLDELGELSEPRTDRHGVTLEEPGPAFPVPLLIRGRHCHPDRLGQPKLLGETPGQLGVAGQRSSIDVAMTR